MNYPQTAQANEHFLAHVANASESNQLSVTEDILAANGMKLVAKGARIDPSVCDRLLHHVLRKPLENCVQVVDGVTAAQLEPLGEALLQRHPAAGRPGGRPAGAPCAGLDGRTD